MALIVGIAEELEYENNGLLKDGEIAVFLLEKENVDPVTPDLSKVLSECYIEPAQLRHLAEINEVSISEQLSEILPDNNTMKSGDFGEILSRQFLQEHEGASFPVYRWRNRSSRNDTVRGTDLIGYMNVGDNINQEDTLILCEVKTRARSVTDEVVKDAYEGVKKDSASRTASSLIFCQARLLQDGDEDGARKIARFRNPHKHPYKKRLIASVVHADATWNDDFLNHLPESHGMGAALKVIVLKVEELAEWIDDVYLSAVELAE